MTRILWYTDATNATSVSGASPLAFGTSKTRPASRTALYDNIVVAGLIAAGWTQHNLATRDDSWTSTGESGGEKIFIRTRYDGSEFLYWYVGTKVDGSNNLQGSIGGGTNAFERWDLGTTDSTFDLILLATADFAWFNVRVQTAGTGVSANDQFNAFVGNTVRDAQTNNNVLTTTGSAAAGTNVTISVSTSDPTSLDYKIGDVVQIVSIATGDAALAETTQIVNVGTNSIEVDNLINTYSTGARIGALPCPTVRFVGKNTDPDTAANWYGPLTFPAIRSASDLASSPGFNFGAVDYCSGSTITAQDGFGTATTANKRTRRFSIRSMTLVSGGNSTVGTIPGIYGYPGSASFYPNDTGTWNRVSPNQRFLMARFVTAGTKNWMLGKSP